ncbi:MAG: tRNA-dihydrouridine synthase family protein [Bdellovibrionota bacterium]
MPSPLDALMPAPICLAPMVGLSHYSVRRAIQEYLPAGVESLWPTEMLSSRRLPREEMNDRPETCMMDAERGLCPQLLGNEEISIRDSIHRLESWGARAVDINMGCPVQKALSHNYGVALMGDIDYAARVTEFAVKHASVPVSVKLRAGLQKDEAFLLRFVKAIENAGASWITLHPRTAEQKRRGYADYAQIRNVVGHVSIPVIGNGDVQTAEDAYDLLESTGCARVMIGRAFLARPWMLREIRRDSVTGALRLEASEKRDPSEEAREYLRFVRRVVEISFETYRPEDVARRLRFFVYHGHRWLDFGHSFYAEMTRAKEKDAFLDCVDRFHEKPLQMNSHTQLRG